MGAVDYFLKITGIEGETQDSMHRGEIEIENWAFGESQAGTMMFGGGGGAGRVSMDDFTFTKRADKSSPKLMLFCASGQHIDEALFTARKAGTTPQEYLKVRFRHCLISNYQTAGTKETDIVPRESVSFNFTEIEMEYRQQLPDGSLGGTVKVNYNLKENRGA